MGKITKAQFRKHFLDKVQGQPVKVQPLQPAPLAPEYPPGHWANRLLECGAINQAILERLSHSGSKRSQQTKRSTTNVK